MGVSLLIFVVLLMILFVVASFVIFRLQRNSAKPLDEENFHNQILHNVKPPK
ncbi:hypothetical protein [Bacillus sp. FJAT-22090]|uniref:hypothetical protein n=1 Tax=Bacillus sp. FJAT-22090 TaxID=1581038 RepID=UPI0016430B05|nr:hypothetical protein [Bacillus sp. FJAT-22090]